MWWKSRYSIPCSYLSRPRLVFCSPTGTAHAVNWEDNTDTHFCRNGWPLDPRDKKLGDWTCLDMLQGVAAVTKLLHLGGLSPEETPAFLESVRYDLTDASMRAYVVGE